MVAFNATRPVSTVHPVMQYYMPFHLLVTPTVAMPASSSPQYKEMPAMQADSNLWIHLHESMKL